MNTGDLPRSAVGVTGPKMNILFGFIYVSRVIITKKNMFLRSRLVERISPNRVPTLLSPADAFSHSQARMRWIRRGRGSPFWVAPASPGCQPLGPKSFVPPATPMLPWLPAACLLISVPATARVSTAWSSELPPGIPGNSGVYGVMQLSCVTQLPLEHGSLALSLLGAVALVRALRFLFDSTLGFPGEGPAWQEHVKPLKENDPTLTELK